MHISIKPETLFHIGNFEVTNTGLTSWIVLFVLIIGSFLIYRTIKKGSRNKFTLLFEIIVEKLMDFLEVFAGNRQTVKKYFPLVATIFFYILASNWMGTLPGVETIGIHEVDKTSVVENNEHLPVEEHDPNDSHEDKTEEHAVFKPLLRTVNSDLNMTLAIALIVVFATHIVGFQTIGAKNHIGKFLVNPIKKPIGFFVGLLEIIGEVSRIISLTFRLFGNIFAGSVLILIISSLVPFIVPIPFLGLELFVGFIQALVFSVLAMLFITSATHSHEEEH